MFDIVKNRRWYFLASGILVALSTAALVVSASTSGLPLSVDINTTDPETIQAAGLTVLVTAITIPAFVWWLFRDRPNALRCSASAIVLMAHTLLVLFGFYALMGMVAGWQAGPTFFVAVLAVVGLAIQDAITALTRIGENASSRRQEPYEVTANRSILEILNPTLTVRLCAVFVLVALLLVGGPTILPLAATLLVGIVCETYAAVFIAVPLLTI
jgi:SecD/SecF fusion protein